MAWPRSSPGQGQAAGRTCAPSASRAASLTEVASFFAYDPAFPGGVSVAAADLTGDGVAEIITGAGPGGGPHVRAFSLAGGVVTEVASFFAYDPAFPGGVHVAAVGSQPHRACRTAWFPFPVDAGDSQAARTT